MEDVVALLARQAGKKFVEAQKAAAADAAKRQAAAGAAVRNAPATARPAAVAQAVPPAPVPAVPVPPAPPAPPAAPALDAGLGGSGLPGIPAARQAPATLLEAFGGGASLLAGIVLSEALGPPVSLRGSQLFDRLER